mgnify:FL=1
MPSLPCMFCGKDVEVSERGLEMQGVFNTFCRGDTDCEDRFAWHEGPMPAGYSWPDLPGDLDSFGH